MNKEKIAQKIQKHGISQFLVLYLDEEEHPTQVSKVADEGIAAALIKNYLDDQPGAASLLKMSFDKGEIKTDPIKDVLFSMFDEVLNHD